jgi:hypothetical protein
MAQATLLTLPRELRDMIYSYLHDDTTTSWLQYSYRGPALTLKSSKVRSWLRHFHLDPLPIHKYSQIYLKVSLPTILDVHPQLRQEYIQTNPGASSAIFNLVASETNWMPHEDYRSDIATGSPRLLRHIREATLCIRVETTTKLRSDAVPWIHIVALAETLSSQAPNLDVLKVILYQHSTTVLHSGDLTHFIDYRLDFFVSPPSTIAGLAYRGTGDGFVVDYADVCFVARHVWPTGSYRPPWHHMTMVAIYSFSRKTVGDEYLPKNNLKVGLFPVVEYPQDVLDLLIEDEQELVKMGPMWIHKWKVRGGDEGNKL